ncbi:MAG: sigma-70 family RNA polymerase sigma factor [bacterium]|nr:sigma-70 family RNA polymerase sigma factor [bacterium]
MKMHENLEKKTDLDGQLTAWAADPDSFEKKAKRLARKWNRDGLELDLAGPDSWRKPSQAASTGRVASLEEQLRNEIDLIMTMDRVAEANLARRIEFSCLMLADALKAEGLTEADLESPSGGGSPCERLPKGICLRWKELQAQRTELVERNLYLALINVEKYAHFGVNRLDLIQEGSTALFRAVDGFDWRRGLLFRTYAVHWLFQAFRSYLYNFSNAVRIPVYMQKALKHVREALGRLGPDASPERIAELTGLPLHQVDGALAANSSTLSLDTPMSGGDMQGGLGNLIGAKGDGDPYDTSMEEGSLHESMRIALALLSARERYVLEKRFGFEQERAHTLSEVATEMGVSLERVRQIQVRALGKMKTHELKVAAEPFL